MITKSANIKISKRKRRSIKDSDCKSEIYALKSRKVGKDKKRYLREGGQSHSGDMTVPYVSLSYAKTWLENGDIRNVEHKPAVIHRHLLENWAPSKMTSKVATVDPATNIYTAKNSKSGEYTAVIEVDGVDHLEIIKHHYVFSLVLDKLLPLMAADLRLNETEFDEGSSTGGNGAGAWPWDQSPGEVINNFLAGVFQFTGLARG